MPDFGQDQPPPHPEPVIEAVGFVVARYIALCGGDGTGSQPPLIVIWDARSTGSDDLMTRVPLYGLYQHVLAFVWSILECILCLCFRQSTRD